MSQDEVPDELSHSLQRMSNLLLSEETVDAILEIVVTLARSTIPGADGAGVTVRRRGPTTAAHSDPMVTDLDDMQYRLGSGPCLAAIEDARRYRVDSTAVEGRWP